MKRIIFAGLFGLMAGNVIPVAAKPVKVFILAGQSNMEGHGCVDLTGPQGKNPYCLVGQVRNSETRPIFAAITERVLPPAGRVTIPVGEDFWRYKDPAPGNPKDLRLEMKIKGETKSFEGHEGGQPIQIPGDPKDMEVVSAQYGILKDGAKTVDVKRVVEGFLREARLPQPVWKTFDNVWVYFHTPRGSLTVGQGASPNLFGPELGFGAVMSQEWQEQVLIIKTAWGGMSLNGPFRPPSANNGVGGWAYTNMIREVRECLADLKKNFPSYAGQGYELAGFVWWHGWNDGCEGKKSVKAYEQNLVRLIQDLRQDLAVPRLPVVITGFTGPTVEGGGVWTEIRQAQANVADASKHPEFKGTVVFVPTHTFVRPPDKSPGGWPCHEHDHPETYFLVGKASGEAMKKLLEETRH
jgi:hypothetical protein